MSRRHLYLDGDLAGVAERAAERARAGDVYQRAAQVLVSECFPEQRGFVTDPGSRIVVLCGGRSGKTTAGRARLMRRAMLTPRADVLFIATSRPQAEKLMWDPLKEIAQNLSVPTYPKESKLELHFGNGSKITLAGADDKRAIERFRGIPRHEVGVDEAASHKAMLLEWLIDRAIGPRLDDFGGVLWMTGTPGHILRGEFYDATCPGTEVSRRWDERDKPEHAGWDGWSLHTWSRIDGARHVPAMARSWANALKTKERKGYSDDHPVWRREYLGMWAADDSADVFRYDPQANSWDPERVGPYRVAKLPTDRTDWEFVFGMDLGSSDPTAITVWAFSPTDDSKRLFQVWEMERRGMYARSIASVLIGDDLNTDAPDGVIGATRWPVGFVSDRDGSGDAIIKELGRVYGIAIEPADKKNYHDSIELFNGDLVDGRVFVLRGSKLEEQIQNQQWAIDDETGKLKKHKGQRDDLTDSAIYARRKAQHMFSAAAESSAPDDPTSTWREAARLAVQRADEFDDEFDDVNDWG